MSWLFEKVIKIVRDMRLKNFSLSFGMPIFRSLSDEARVRILNLLIEKKEMCITDLEHILDFTQTKTSRHLAYLKNSGIVATRKIDQWVFYSVREEVYDFISQVMTFVKKDPTLLSDLENYDIMYSNRELAAYKIESRKYLA